MENLIMSKNEYKEYVNNLISKVWTDENYSMKTFNTDVDCITVLPFDLEKYNLRTETENYIHKIFDTDGVNRDGVYYLKGFTGDEWEWYDVTEKLSLTRITGYYYSGYAYNDTEKFYMTHCEGDIYLNLFDNEYDYKKSLNDYIEWYENEM